MLWSITESSSLVPVAWFLEIQFGEVLRWQGEVEVPTQAGC